MRHELIYLNGFMYAIDKSVGLIHPNKNGYYQIEDESKIWEYNDLKRGWYTLDDIPCTIVGAMRVYPVVATNDPSLNLPLLPAVEEDVEQLAIQYATHRSLPRSEEWFVSVDGFIAGYKAASSKQFTEEDFYNFTQLLAEKFPSLKRLSTSQAEDYPKVVDALLMVKDEFIQSLKPRPVAVELDMKEDIRSSMYGSNLDEYKILTVDENNYVKVKQWYYESN